MASVNPQDDDISSEVSFEILDETVKAQTGDESGPMGSSMGSVERMHGQLLALLMQSVPNEIRAGKTAALVQHMIRETVKSTIKPYNMYRVVSARKITLNPVNKKDSGYQSLQSFLQSFAALSASRDVLADARKVYMFRPFNVNYNAGGNTQYLDADEHCYARYDSEAPLHLFKCFGGAREPDEIATVGYVTHEDQTLDDLPPRVLQGKIADKLAVPSLKELMKRVAPFDATAPVEAEEWLHRHGYALHMLSKDDVEYLMKSIKSNVDTILTRLRVGAEAVSKKRVPEAYLWYRKYYDGYRMPDCGWALIMESVMEALSAQSVTSWDKDGTLRDLSESVDREAKKVSGPAAGETEAETETVANVFQLYSNMDKYQQNQKVTVAQFTGKQTYVRKGDVWHKVAGKHVPDHVPSMLRTAAYANAVDALKAQESVAKNANRASLQALLRMFMDRKEVGDRRQDVYKPGALVERGDLSEYVNTFEDAMAAGEPEFTHADNPLFYRVSDPFAGVDVGDNSENPTDEPAYVETIKALTDASGVKLTSEGETWLANNLEFYNSATDVQEELRKSDEKYRATLQALKNSAEWEGATSVKRTELESRIQKMSEAHRTTKMNEFRKRAALLGGALLAVLVSTRSRYLDGVPVLKLTKACSKKQGGSPSVLSQAYDLIGCALIKARMVAEADSKSMHEFGDIILRDKPDMAGAMVTGEVPWTVDTSSPESSVALVDAAEGGSEDVLAAAVPRLAPYAVGDGDEDHGEGDGLVLEMQQDIDSAKIAKIVTQTSDVNKNDAAKSDKPTKFAELVSKLDVDALQSDVITVLKDHGIKDADVFESVLTVASRPSVEDYLRSFVMTLLSRISNKYVAQTTSSSKVYLDRDMRNAIDTVHTDSVAHVLHMVSTSDALQKNLQKIWSEAGAHEGSFGEDVTKWFLAYMLAITNLPPSADKGTAFEVDDMLDVTAKSVGDKAKDAVLDYITTGFVDYVRKTQGDIAALKAKKTEARDLRDAIVRQKYEALDPEVTKTISVMRKQFDFADWKKIVDEFSESPAFGDTTPGEVIEDGDVDEEDGMEDAENEDEVDDDAETGGFVRHDD